MVTGECRRRWNDRWEWAIVCNAINKTRSSCIKGGKSGNEYVVDG